MAFGVAKWIVGNSDASANLVRMSLLGRFIPQLSLHMTCKRAIVNNDDEKRKRKRRCLSLEYYRGGFAPSVPPFSSFQRRHNPSISSPAIKKKFILHTNQTFEPNMRLSTTTLVAALASLAAAAELKPRLSDYQYCLGQCSAQFTECLDTTGEVTESVIVLGIVVAWYVDLPGLTPRGISLQGR